jgi:hypothetical protein
LLDEKRYLTSIWLRLTSKKKKTKKWTNWEGFKK